MRQLDSACLWPECNWWIQGHWKVPILIHWKIWAGDILIDIGDCMHCALSSYIQCDILSYLTAISSCGFLPCNMLTTVKIWYASFGSFCCGLVPVNSLIMMIALVSCHVTLKNYAEVIDIRLARTMILPKQNLKTTKPKHTWNMQGGAS